MKTIDNSYTVFCIKRRVLRHIIGLFTAIAVLLLYRFLITANTHFGNEINTRTQTISMLTVDSGIEDIQQTCWKNAGEEGIAVIIAICQKMGGHFKWSQDWKNIVPIFLIDNPMTRAIMPYASKLLLKCRRLFTVSLCADKIKI